MYRQWLRSYSRVCQLAWLAMVTAACSSPAEIKGGNGSGTNLVQPPARPTFTLFALAEVRGQIGPCGCTSDPLGDLARTTRLIADARASGPVLVVDAGSLLYSQSPVPPHLDAQEELKADLLATTYQNELAVAAVGLGPADLAKGPDKLRLPRMVENLKPEANLPTKPGEVIAVGDAKVGVFGVVTADALPGVPIADPVAAGKAAVADLRSRGARVVVALVQARSKRAAVELARDIGGIDITVAGLGRAAPEPELVENEPHKVGAGWLVMPGNRGQVLSRIEVTLRGDGPLADAVGERAAQIKIGAYELQLAELDAAIAKAAANPTADPAFVEHKRAERADIAAKRDALRQRPLQAPATGSYLTLAQIRINKTLACSSEVDTRVSKYFSAAGAANVKAAAGTKPLPPAKGKASFVGGSLCEDCHAPATEFWKKTVHAGAWKTLVDRGQQFDLDCIGCHVTGWSKPGGSNLAVNETLRDVQCEVCHGPGSIHVNKGGEEKPAAVWLAPPTDYCANECHTREHSDTFELNAYLRDILGPGHGEAARKKLGDGPTGAQLRKAALDKAGRKLGANCSR